MKKNLVLDTNIWINTLLQVDSYKKLLEVLVTKKSFFQLVMDSYGAVEAMHSLKNLAKTIHASSTMYERAFWSILDNIGCLLDFEIPISNDLLKVAKNKTEYIMLAETYGLEVKDVPIIVLAFKHKATFLTSDVRSIIEKRGNIQSKLQIELLSLEEFFKNYSL